MLNQPLAGNLIGVDLHAERAFDVCMYAAEKWGIEDDLLISEDRSSVCWWQTEQILPTLSSWLHPAGNSEMLALEVTSWRGFATIFTRTNQCLILVISAFPQLTAALTDHFQEIAQQLAIPTRDLTIDLVHFARAASYDVFCVEYIKNTFTIIKERDDRADNVKLILFPRDIKSDDMVSVSVIISGVALKIFSDLAIEIDGEAIDGSASSLEIIVRVLSALSNEALPGALRNAQIHVAI